MFSIFSKLLQGKTQSNKNLMKNTLTCTISYIDYQSIGFNTITTK